LLSLAEGSLARTWPGSQYAAAVPLRPTRYPSGVRLFDVECECGEEFRVPVDLDEARSRPDRGFLVPLEGRCPWCGLLLERIEPFADPAPRQTRRS
jgi:hypothetical protein